MCIKGTVNSNLLSSGELFLSAMRYRAVSIILVHNHPRRRSDTQAMKTNV